MAEAKQSRPAPRKPEEKKVDTAAASKKPERKRPDSISIIKAKEEKKDDLVPPSPSKIAQQSLDKIETSNDKLIEPKPVLTPAQEKAFQSELDAILKTLDANHKEFEALQKKSVSELAAKFKTIEAFHEQCKTWVASLEPKPAKDEAT